MSKIVARLRELIEEYGDALIELERLGIYARSRNVGEIASEIESMLAELEAVSR